MKKKPSIDLNQEVEVICKKGDRVVLKVMSYQDFKTALQNPLEGWSISCFQIGFSQYRNAKK